jgi:hypothetical protein
MSSAAAVAVARTSTPHAASAVRKPHIALAAIPLIASFELTPTLAKWFCHITRASIADTASGLCLVYDSALATITGRVNSLLPMGSAEARG